MSKKGKGTEGGEQQVTVGSLGDPSGEGIKNERVRLVRFLTGQELITELVAETETHYTFRNPLAFAAHKDQNSNQVHIAFGEFMPFTDEQECDILKSLVLLCYPPEDILINKYRETFGKIIIPSRDLKTGSLLTG